MSKNEHNKITRNKNDNSDGRKGRIIAIIIFVISVIATNVITWFSDDFKYIFPPKIETSIGTLGSYEVVMLDGSDEYIHEFKYNELCAIESYIENNSDDAVNLKNVKVVVDEFTDYENLKYTEDDMGGSGGLKEPYIVEATLDSGEKNAIASPVDKDKYLVVNAHDEEKVILWLFPTDKGVYKIHLEYEMVYHGKTRNIHTESLKFLYAYFGEAIIDKSDLLSDQEENESNKENQYLSEIGASIYTHLDINQDGKEELLALPSNLSDMINIYEDTIMAEWVYVYSVSDEGYVCLGLFSGADNVAYNSEMKCLQVFSGGLDIDNYTFGSIEDGQLIERNIGIEKDPIKYYFTISHSEDFYLDWMEEYDITEGEVQRYIDSFEANNDYI